MARCGFKTNVLYRDEKTREYISEYVCPEPEENILDSGLCIFHSEQYLKDPKNKEANKLNIKRKLAEKIQKPEPLICIGYYLSDISFSGMHFDKSVNFSKTVFVGRSDFSEAQFTEANFNSAQFTEANFNSAQFTEANFRGAEFNVGLFITTQFNKIGDFRGAQFEIAVFNGAQFRRIANFETAHIKEANFSGAHFKEKANFSSINAHTDLEAPRLDFRDVQFDDQEHVVFMKNDLTKVSFLNTDISKIKFGDVIWGNNFKILEETELEKLLNLKTTGIMVGVR